MIRIIHLYDRGKGQLSFLPTGPRDRPVFSSLVNQVGVRLFDDRIVIPRAGPDGLTTQGFVLAARLRMFRLRVQLDRLWPHSPRAHARYRLRAKARQPAGS